LDLIFSPDSTLHAFVDVVMRSLDLQTSNEIVKEHGIEMYRFRIVPSDLQNETQNPINSGFYQFGPFGVFNRTSTAQGAPLFLSKPHFLDADPFYLQNLIGLNPNRILHDSWIDVEPITGTTMNAVERLQVNLEISPSLLLYQNVKPVLQPVLWIQQYSTIPKNLAHQFRETVYLAEKVSNILKYIALIAGPIFAVLSLIFVGIHLVLVKRKKRKNEKKKKIDYKCRSNEQ